MANNNEFENEQGEAFGSNGNYRQGFSSAIVSSRPSKIVTPLSFNRGFNASGAIRKNDRRTQEELPPEANETTSNDEMPKDNLGDKVKEKAVNMAANKLPPGLKGVGKNIINNTLAGGSSGKVDQALFKAQKMKLYLIAGGVFFGFFIFIAIIFAVTSTGGTETSGAGFNEVSEYELEQDDSDIVDEEPEEVVEETDQTIEKGVNDEGLTE